MAARGGAGQIGQVKPMSIGKFSRRTALGGLSRAALIGAITAMSLNMPSALTAQQRIAIPTQAMRLSRRLARDLRGQEQVKVVREWSVRFINQAAGIAIVGEEKSARVDAPAALRPLAQIEEMRSTNGMFPLQLSENGIVLSAGVSNSAVDVLAALQTAEEMIARAPVPPHEQSRHVLFVSHLLKSGSSGMGRIAPDLFFPNGKAMRDKRQIALPDGQMGAFETLYQAFPTQGKGWLRRSIREVITRVGLDVRRSVEEWTLEPLEPLKR